jgi:hypothetical protein
MKKEKSLPSKSKKTLKTFNLNEEIYKKFSDHCRSQGISMSKKIENFLQDELKKLKFPKSQLKEIKPETHSFSKYC